MSKFYTVIENYGNQMLTAGYENGIKFFDRVKFSPELFIETNKETEYKNLWGNNLEKISFTSVSDARDFVQRYKDVDNFKYYGMDKWLFQFISKEYDTTILYDFSKIKIAYVDIETNVGDPNNPDEVQGFGSIELANQPITAITMIMGNHIISFGCKDYIPDNKRVKYLKFKDEKAMLDGFINIFSNYKPDIVSGWNSDGFDIPYIIRRCNQIVDEDRTKDLSPWRIIKDKKVPNMRGETVDSYDIFGVSHIDYMSLFRKFGNKQVESYALNNVAFEILGTKKIDYSEYGDLGTLYRENFQKFMDYNIQDTLLMEQLEEKMKLFELLVLTAYYSKVNYIDVFKNTRVWDSLIYNYLKEKNIIIDCSFQTDNSQIAGGYVKDPVPGKYENIVTYDATSLYPHIIMSWAISPENFVKKVSVDVDDMIQNGNPYKKELIKNNWCMAANGSIFKRQSGFLGRMMHDLFLIRKSYKDKMLECDKLIVDATEQEKIKLIADRNLFDNYQNAKKILLNSNFGSLAANGFRYCHSNFSEAITLSGQYTIKMCEKHLNIELNKIFDTNNVKFVIASDTDSLIVNYQTIIQKMKITDKMKAIEFLEKFSEKLEPIFQKITNMMVSELNMFENRIHIKLEKVCDFAIYRAKKNYILSSWSSEGTRYKEAKITIKGLEGIKTSTPSVVRKAMKKSYFDMLYETNNIALDTIKKFKEEYINFKPEDIAFPKGCNGIEKYSSSAHIYTKGTPGHTRAGLLYNHLIDKYSLSSKYPKIIDGQKIKFIYLKIPNPIGENIIGFINRLPEEFQLHEYVDYDTMFAKSYEEPIHNMMKIINWKTNDEKTLEDFFN